MFTGIIEATAPVLKRTDSQFILERPASFDDIEEGSSIAVSGACLSVVDFDASSMTFDVVPETWSKTKLGSLVPGDRVNLERAMKATDRFDGHIVQGHVEGVGRVVTFDSPSPEGFLYPPGPLSPGGDGSIRSEAPTPGPSPDAGEGSSAERVYRGIGKKKYPAKSTVANARFMRKNPTGAEAAAWEILRDNRFHGFYFRRQRPVGRCILDFYCEELKLGIELDGSIHDDIEQAEYDEERTDVLNARGITIIRFRNEDVLNDPIEFRRKLSELIKQHTETSPSPADGGGARGGGLMGQAERETKQHTQTLLTLQIPPPLTPFLIPKGSITLDGVALTIADLDDELCSIALIPHTLEHTTLGSLREGDLVNIETDILVRTLYHLSAHAH